MSNGIKSKIFFLCFLNEKKNLLNQKKNCIKRKLYIYILQFCNKFNIIHILKESKILGFLELTCGSEWEQSRKKNTLLSKFTTVSSDPRINQGDKLLFFVFKCNFWVKMIFRSGKFSIENIFGLRSSTFPKITIGDEKNNFILKIAPKHLKWLQLKKKIK